MTSAFVVEAEDELSVMRVPLQMATLPEDMRAGLAFWHLVAAVQAQEGSILVGPPKDITWFFCFEPADVDKVQLKRACEHCDDGLWTAREALIAGEGPIAITQFKQGYLRNVKALVGNGHRQAMG